MMRKFKEETGYTIHNYIISKRLLLARTKISEGTPILKAAQLSGFSSCNFAEVAKAYGISSACMDANEVAEKAADFLHGTEAPKLLEIRLEPGTFAYPKTCLGEPIHNQQPYIPKDVYDRLMDL